MEKHNEQKSLLYSKNYVKKPFEITDHIMATFDAELYIQQHYLMVCSSLTSMKVVKFQS
jgi:hypothetical protein